MSIDYASNDPPARSPVWALPAALLVLAWRILAHLYPSSAVIVAESSRFPFAAMALFFVSCGLVTVLIRPTYATTLFLVSCLGAGLHWGGAIGAASISFERGLLVFYLAMSAIGEAAFLHLALVFPDIGRRSKSRYDLLLYLPGCFGFLLIPFVSIVSNQWIEISAGGLLLFANLLSYSAGVVFIRHLLKAPRGPLKRHLAIIVFVLVTSSLIAIPGENYNLAFSSIPASLAFALLKSRDHLN